MNLNDNWKPKLLVLGTLIGAGIGMLTAMNMANAIEEEGENFELDFGDVLKTGLSVFTTMKGVAALGAAKR